MVWMTLPELSGFLCGARCRLGTPRIGREKVCVYRRWAGACSVYSAAGSAPDFRPGETFSIMCNSESEDFKGTLRHPVAWTH